MTVAAVKGLQSHNVPEELTTAITVVLTITICNLAAWGILLLLLLYIYTIYSIYYILYTIIIICTSKVKKKKFSDIINRHPTNKYIF